MSKFTREQWNHRKIKCLYGKFHCDLSEKITLVELSGKDQLAIDHKGDLSPFFISGVM